MDEYADIQARVAANVAAIEQAITSACRRGDRPRSSVRAVAVTKYVGLQAVRAVMDAGIIDLGESRVQQLRPRVEALGSRQGDLDAAGDDRAPRWHMIGHLQRNKVKYLLPEVRIVHSVDSPRLATELAERADQAATGVDVFLEVNVAGEENKHGVALDGLAALAEHAVAHEHLRVRGLMTMAPYSDDPEAARPHFARLRGTLEDLRSKGVVPPTCSELSMGMSGDYIVGIEEGATVVRIGSALFAGLTGAQRKAD
jgi:hypothetical protein